MKTKFKGVLGFFLFLILLLMIGSAFLWPHFFFPFYLSSTLFWLGIPLGCLGLSLIGHLTGGQWAGDLRPWTRRGGRTLPFMLGLTLPLIFSLEHLFPWMREKMYSHKAVYFSLPFFYGRLAFYFLSWWFLQRTFMGTRPAKAAAGYGWGLVLFAFTLSFFSVDFLMSLHPHWYSAVFPIIFMVGELLSSLALILAVAYLTPSGPWPSPAVRQDLGSLLFALVMVWAYLSFSQYLIIWHGNRPDEVEWFIPRSRGIWGSLGVVILFFHFIIPFLLLLNRKVKKGIFLAGPLSLTLSLAHALSLHWQILPAFPRLAEGPFLATGLGFLIFLGMGAFWFWAFSRGEA